MKKIMVEIICFLLVLLFVYAALSKLFNYEDFKFQLHASPLIKSLAIPLSIILPVTELITAGMLVITITRKTGLILSFILLFVFTGYIVYMLLTQAHLPCSCGGVLKQLTWKEHIIFNSFFLVLAAVGIRIEKNINEIPGKEFKNIVVQQ
jgi:hypothetical protein